VLFVVEAIKLSDPPIITLLSAFEGHKGSLPKLLFVPPIITPLEAWLRLF
jgi:hypothetical protein